MSLPSFSTVTPGNMDMGPCRVKFNSVDLGGTLEGVKIHWEPSKGEIKSDQLGSTVLDRVLSGLNITVETMLLELAAKSIWKVAMPYMDSVASGAAGYFQNKVGQKDSSLWQTLLLHPLTKADSDLSADLTIYRAVAEGKSDLIYKPDGQIGLKVLWNAYPDTSVNPPRFCFLGDPANGLVACVIGTPAFTGTGNGTCTLTSGNNSYTKTETITITCIGINGANKSAWKVVGSVSGILGTVEMTGGAGGTQAFVSNPINFTLTDGATDFVVGDVFTIATTAANYA